SRQLHLAQRCETAPAGSGLVDIVVRPLHRSPTFDPSSNSAKLQRQFRTAIQPSRKFRSGMIRVRLAQADAGQVESCADWGSRHRAALSSSQFLQVSDLFSSLEDDSPVPIWT